MLTHGKYKLLYRDSSRQMFFKQGTPPPCEKVSFSHSVLDLYHRAAILNFSYLYQCYHTEAGRTKWSGFYSQNDY